MKDDIENGLDALFADARKKKDAAVEKRDLEAEAQKSFLDRFLEVRTVVIIPALSEFAKAIGKGGWAADIVTYEDAPSTPGPYRQPPNPAVMAAAGLLFWKGETRPAVEQNSLPAFQLFCMKDKRLVAFFELTIGPGHGGSAGGAGTASLDQITTDFVQERVLAYFKKLMNDARPYDER